MSNLTQRVVTAVILIPLVVAAVLWLPWYALGALFGVAVLAGAWEWSALAGWRTLSYRVAFVCLIGASLLAAALLPSTWGVWLCVAAGLWWLYAIYRVLALQRTGVWQRPSAPVWILHGWMLLVPAWLALMLLHRSGAAGPGLVLLLMVMIWLADIGAYFAGRAFGRRKLASNVSPGKSWEGAVGGSVSALLGALVYVVWIVPGPLAGFMALALSTVALSVFGDLTESAFKRISGIKDSGGLLPGHGGVLDRVDSLTAASPFFLLGALVLGIA